MQQDSCSVIFKIDKLQSSVSEYECIASTAQAIHSGAWKLHCFTVITPTDRCIPPLIIDHNPGDIISYCCTDGMCRGLILKWVYQRTIRCISAIRAGASVSLRVPLARAHLVEGLQALSSWRRGPHRLVAQPLLHQSTLSRMRKRLVKSPDPGFMICM